MVVSDSLVLCCELLDSFISHLGHVDTPLRIDAEHVRHPELARSDTLLEQLSSISRTTEETNRVAVARLLDTFVARASMWNMLGPRRAVGQFFDR